MREYQDISKLTGVEAQLKEAKSLLVSASLVVGLVWREWHDRVDVLLGNKPENVTKHEKL